MNPLSPAAADVFLYKFLKDNIIVVYLLFRLFNIVPGSWQPYDKMFSDQLEQAFHKKVKTVDFQQSLGMPYKVDLNKMTQTRIETKKKRKVQRVPVSQPVQYLAATSADFTVGGGGATGSAGAPVFGASTAAPATLPMQPTGATAAAGSSWLSSAANVANGLLTSVSNKLPAGKTVSGSTGAGSKPGSLTPVHVQHIKPCAAPVHRTISASYCVCMCMYTVIKPFIFRCFGLSFQQPS